MNWYHIQLIYFREMRDQLRDRRTLFTITVLPLLLYPLLGMLMMQVAQFKREQTVLAEIVGLEHWPKSEPLLASASQSNGNDADDAERKRTELLQTRISGWPKGLSQEEVIAGARETVNSGMVDVVLVVHPQFESLLEERRLAKLDGTQSKPAESSKASSNESNSSSNQDSSSTAVTQTISVDGLTVVANMARDRGQLAVKRLQAKLDDWHQRWISDQLKEAGVNPVLVQPIPFAQNDTSESSVRRAMIWSKVLPFIMLVWALTGAFYPAIDLCAGEKERGTLETLLSSPARRREIVWGKLFTVATFSVLSALLNLLSMQLTAGFIMEQLALQGGGNLSEMLGPLPVHAFGWLVLLLLPMSAFFSALALAVAALARSTKEGQYYLMPLLLFALPLVTLPMIPSLELNLATSLVPVSGAIFVVRSLIEGRIAEGVIYLPMVIGVTGFCCLLSIRWAVKQFESESVMFSDIERWNFQSWIRQIWRDRGVTASPSEAALCGAIILVAVFFSQFVLSSAGELPWNSLVQRAVLTQIGLILTPTLLMATILTRSLRHSLRLHAVPPIQLIAALLLGIAFHPTYTLIGEAISATFKIGAETEALLKSFAMLINAQPLWAILLVMAIIPAVCEEITYRGFIFGGLLRNGGSVRAILLSALFFGFTHGLLQQSIAATIMGILLGVIAWRTGSILPTMIIHVMNNCMSLTLSWLSARQTGFEGNLDLIVQLETGSWHYQAGWIALSMVVSGLMVVVLWHRNPTTQQLAQSEAI